MTHIRRVGEMQRTVKVYYKTRDGSAKAGEDYEHSEGEVVFGPDEVTKEVPINIIDDKAYEDDEEFYVDLKDPICVGGYPAKIGDIATAEVTIIDDDEPGVLSFETDVLHVP